jgi:hypothetical protein
MSATSSLEDTSIAEAPCTTQTKLAVPIRGVSMRLTGLAKSAVDEGESTCGGLCCSVALISVQRPLLLQIGRDIIDPTSGYEDMRLRRRGTVQSWRRGRVSIHRPLPPLEGHEAKAEPELTTFPSTIAGLTKIIG